MLLAVITLCSTPVPVFGANFPISDGDGRLTIGPLTQGQEIELVRGRLQQGGLSFREETNPNKQSLGFIVVTDTYPDKESAQTDLRQLADAGIRDYLYVSRGDYVNRISAGVFSQRASAERQAENLREKGFSFSVIERFRTDGTSTGFVVREPGLTPVELERVLAGQVIPSRTVKAPITAAPVLQEGEIRVEKSSPSTGTVPESVTETVTETASAPAPTLEPSPPSDASAEPATANSARQPAPPVVRQAPSTADYTWLWFLGIFIIIIGAVAFYFLQRRSEQPASRTHSKVPAPEPVSSASTGTSKDETPPPTRQVIYDYAEEVLEGKSGDSASRSLTILGTEDTSITDLIQDLLFLIRLEEKKERIEAFAFDSRSLVTNLIDRLSAEDSSASFISSPADNLPVLLSLDANKFARILTILTRHAMTRTESGLISIHQQFGSGQLNTEILFNPSSEHIEAELESMINPAMPNPVLTVGERVRFGVANRLTTVLGGRLDTGYERGEAFISIRLPATEIKGQQLSLPSGKTIDELLAAETRAEEEIRKNREDADARVREATARASSIEQDAAQSIQVLKDELSGINAASAKRARDLETSEIAIESLRSQLALTISERDEKLIEEQAQRKAALADLDSVNAELLATRTRLEEERQARASLEAEAQTRVEQLEQALVTTRTAVEQEAKIIRAKEEAARAQVEDLESQLINLQTAMDVESKQALQVLRERLVDAESRLSQETDTRSEAEDAAHQQVKDLQEQLHSARVVADKAAQEKQALDEELKSAISQLENSRDTLQARVNRLEQDSQAALAEVDQLQTRLAEASEALALEKAARVESEQAANETVARLEAELKLAKESRDAAVARQEERISSSESEVSRLTASLHEAERKLDEQAAAQQDSAASEEVARLQAELTKARTHLDSEVTRRNTAEASAGTQINELIDELNQLRANAADIKEESLHREQAKEALVASIQSELAAARQALEQEREQKNGIQAASDQNLSEMTERLSLLELEHDAMQAKAERAEAFSQRQTAMLEDALNEVQSAQKLGDAARKVTQHLKMKIKHLESRVEDLQAGAALTQATELPVPDLPAEPAEELPDEPVLDLPDEPAQLSTSHSRQPTDNVDVSLDEADFSLDSFDDDTEEDIDDDILADDTFTEDTLIDEMDEDIDEAPPEDSPSAFSLEPAPELSIEPSSSLEMDANDSTPESETEPEPASLTMEDAPVSPGRAVFNLPPMEEPEVADKPEQAPAPPAIASSPGDDIAFGSPAQPAEVSAAAPTEPDEEEPDFDFQFSDKPIRSSQPVSNPVLHSMIERFVERLFSHIESMEEALARREYLELVVSCNWVRGEANTLGFEALNTPLDAIEYQLRRRKFSQIITHLAELRNMAERIETKQTASADAPIQYFVPANAKNAVLYENFVSQLGSKLLELEVAAHASNTRQMTQLCRWIDRYGEKIRFLEVIEASRQLQEAIGTGDSEIIDAKLMEFIELYAKIEIIREEAPA